MEKAASCEARGFLFDFTHKNSHFRNKIERHCYDFDSRRLEKASEH
jgi:hypothetical protein